MTDEQAPDHYEITLQVVDDDIDDLGHVNNVVYLRWVQDVAAAHWRTLAPEDEQNGLQWVVMRHEIDYQSPAGPGEVIAVRTWVGQAEGLRFDRHTEIRRHADGKVLVRARTVWCPIDAKSGRPRRVSPTVRRLFSAPPPPSAGDSAVE